MPYCVDTSAWMDGWVRYYPPDVFPTLWHNLEGFITAGEIISSDEVYVETSKKADELHEWIKDRKQMLVSLSPQVQQVATDLLRDYPRLVDTLKEFVGKKSSCGFLSSPRRGDMFIDLGLTSRTPCEGAERNLINTTQLDFRPFARCRRLSLRRL